MYKKSLVLLTFLGLLSLNHVESVQPLCYQNAFRGSRSIMPGCSQSYQSSTLGHSYSTSFNGSRQIAYQVSPGSGFYRELPLSQKGPSLLTIPVQEASPCYFGRPLCEINRSTRFTEFYTPYSSNDWNLRSSFKSR